MVLVFGKLTFYEHLVPVSPSFFPELNDLTKKDVMIFFPDDQLLNDERLLPWLDKQPYSTLILDGDNDVYKRYINSEKIRKFNGSVHRISESVYHAADSSVFRFGNLKILILNIGRLLHISDNYFFEMNRAMIKNAFKSLKRNNYKVDYVVSILPPRYMAKRFSGLYQNDLHSQYINKIARCCKFKEWYFSYYDEDLSFGRFHNTHRRVFDLGGQVFINCLNGDEEIDNYP